MSEVKILHWDEWVLPWSCQVIIPPTYSIHQKLENVQSSLLKNITSLSWFLEYSTKALCGLTLKSTPDSSLIALPACLVYTGLHPYCELSPISLLHCPRSTSDPLNIPSLSLESLPFLSHSFSRSKLGYHFLQDTAFIALPSQHPLRPLPTSSRGGVMTCPSSGLPGHL